MSGWMTNVRSVLNSLGPRSKAWGKWSARVIRTAAGLVVLWVGVDLLIPVVVDLKALEQQTLEEIRLKTGARIKTDGVVVHLVPWRGLKIQLAAPKISAPDGHLLAELKQVALYMRWSTLLNPDHKEIALIELKDPTLWLDGQKAWQQLRLPPQEGTPLISLRDTRLEVRKGLLLDDGVLNPGKTSLFRLNRLSLGGLGAEKDLEMDLSGAVAQLPTAYRTLSRKALTHLKPLASLEAQGSAPEGPWRQFLEAAHQPEAAGRPDLAVPQAKVSFSVQDVNLSALSVWLPAHISQSLQVKGQPVMLGGILQKATLSLNHTRPPATDPTPAAMEGGSQHSSSQHSSSQQPASHLVVSMQVESGPRFSTTWYGQSQTWLPTSVSLSGISDRPLTLKGKLDHMGWEQWGVSLTHGKAQVDLNGTYMPQRRPKTPLTLALKARGVRLSDWQDIPAFDPSIALLHEMSGVVAVNLNGEGTLKQLAWVGEWQLNGVDWTPHLDGKPVNGIRKLDAHGEMDAGGGRVEAKAASLLGSPFSLSSQMKAQTAKGKLVWRGVDLSQACRLANQFKGQSKLSTLPGVPLENWVCQGQVSTDLSWAGSVKIPEMRGQIELKGVGFGTAPVQSPRQAPRQALWLTHAVNGQVRFSPRQWQWQSVSGQILGGTWRLTGGADAARNQINTRLALAGVDAHQAHQILAGTAFDSVKRAVGLVPEEIRRQVAQTQWRGVVQATTDMVGKLDRPQVKMDATLVGDIRVQEQVFSQLHVVMAVVDHSVHVEKFAGKYLEMPFLISGDSRFDENTTHLVLQVPRMELATLWRNVLGNPTFARELNKSGLSRDLQALQGHGQLSLNLDVDANQRPRWDGLLVIQDFGVQLRGMKARPKVSRLTVNLSSSQGVRLAPTAVMLGEVPATVSLQMGEKHYHIKLDTPSVPVSAFRELVEGLSDPVTGKPMPKLWNVAGAVRLNADLSDVGPHVLMGFEDAGASWQGCEFPLYKLNGVVEVERNGDVHTAGITGRYGNSPLHAAFRYNPRTGKLDGDGDGELSSLLLTHVLIPRDMPHWLNLSLPYQVGLEGKLVNAGKLFDEGNQMNISLDAGIPTEATLLPELDAPEGAVGGRPVDLFGLKAVAHLKGDDLEVSQGEWTILESGKVAFGGGLQNLGTPERSKMAMWFKTPEPVDFSKMAANPRLKADVPTAQWVQNLKGRIETDMHMRREEDGTGEAEGRVVLDGLSIPHWDLTELSLVGLFEKQQARFELKRFALPGVDLTAEAVADNLMVFPLHLNAVKIGGKEINLAQFMQFSEHVFIPQVQNGLLMPIIRPPKAWEPLLPVEFKDADLHFDEMVYQNIILSNVTGKLTTFAGGYTELRNLAFDAAGGKVTGAIAFNPRNENFLTLELYPENVKANALARALLKLPNVIFGDVNGLVRFTTQGLTPDDMLKNANGVTNFVITNGRLPQIARIETLLTGANILRGGIVGLNFNNLIRALKPFDTNYFSTLSGDFQIASGVLYTQNLLSDGDNLDLSIQGWIRLVDGQSDLAITGAMSQDVSGVLGALGKISIGRLLSFVPGVGYLPNSRAGILGVIPGVGFIPGFGGPAKDINKFRVQIQGLIEDTSAIHNLEWLR